MAAQPCDPQRPWVSLPQCISNQDACECRCKHRCIHSLAQRFEGGCRCYAAATTVFTASQHVLPTITSWLSTIVGFKQCSWTCERKRRRICTSSKHIFWTVCSHFASHFTKSDTSPGKYARHPILGTCKNEQSQLRTTPGATCEPIHEFVRSPAVLTEHDAT